MKLWLSMSFYRLEVSIKRFRMYITGEYKLTQAIEVAILNEWWFSAQELVNRLQNEYGPTIEVIEYQAQIEMMMFLAESED